jgi:hypothetical protein
MFYIYSIKWWSPPSKDKEPCYFNIWIELVTKDEITDAPLFEMPA